MKQSLENRVANLEQIIKAKSIQIVSSNSEEESLKQEIENLKERMVEAGIEDIMKERRRERYRSNESSVAEDSNSENDLVQPPEHLKD
jgi:ATP-dependent DNA ligase